ncbi:hypothetical protein [Acaryochloris sp. IP29b_bin.148]|uniref:hypothetical protein n=1 Tax=Acaryochloris sp. IP29b_bin.148 TaxID=2969218 RepID=UPI0026203C05|nr:hypothetical protein [Acaryochloris sp. IP29b_bin.148]
MTDASTRQQSRYQSVSWWRLFVTVVVLFNLGLVLFHLSYGSLRSQIFQWFPQLVYGYDPIYENGLWRVDRYFAAFFGLEYLRETGVLSRQRRSITWPQAMLRRWYNLLLLLPFWQWLRIIPAGIYIHRAELANVEAIITHITHEPIAYLADRVSMFMLVRLVNQTQDAVKQGDAARLLLQSDNYIHVGGNDTLDAIADRLLQLTFGQVIPQLQPELEMLLHQSLASTIKRSDIYKTIEQVPGIAVLPLDLTDQLADALAQSTYEILTTSYQDPTNRQLFEQLAQSFKQVLRYELSQTTTQQEIQHLLSDLLEELKLNYIQRSTQRDSVATLQEVNQLQESLEGSDP